MKIGIGLLTYKREECKELFLEQLKKNPPSNEYLLHIEEDNTSISNGKNNCLEALSDCDYIFLFDDDCFVITKNWDLPFINSEHHHLLFLNKNYNLVEKGDVISRYKDCSGCFLFIKKEAFKKVGYFNTEYPRNGMEHVGYSSRIHKAYGEKGFFSLNDTDKYIYSIDLQGFNHWMVRHQTTINPNDRVLAIKSNADILYKEVNNEKIFYENNIYNKLVL